MQHRTASVRFRRIDGLLLTIISLWSIGAGAVDLTDCKTTEDDAKRLACYDAVTGRVVTPPVSKDAPQAASVPKDAPSSGIGLVAAQLMNTTRPGAKASSLDERWDLDGDPSPPLFALRPYKPIYILPGFYQTSPNVRATSPNPQNTGNLLTPVDHLEAKFQFSLKAKLANDVGFGGSNFWLAYTQSSRWQVYNSERSRPFRESDYEPELIYTAPTHYSFFGVDGKMVGLSLTHQSNGRDDPQSRSWNRIIGQIGLEAGDWTVMVRPWLRIRERVDKDDNPDILNYLGRGEVVAVRKIGNQQLALTLRHSLRAGDESHGSVTVDYAFPIYGYLRGHVQAFTGYGESLIDYNHHTNAVGLGISLGEWL